MAADKTTKLNKFATFKYHVEKKYEAGIVLQGLDVKAIRANKFEIRDAFVREQKGELYLHNINFFDRPEGGEKRKLLLHKQEIKKILTMMKNKRIWGFVLAVRYNEKNKVKFDIGFGTTKKIQDKKSSERRSTDKRTFEKEANQY